MINGSIETKEVVFIENKNTALMKLIKTGIQNDTYIRILEGLNGNETVISRQDTTPSIKN